jgi:hypothetical protein
MPTDELHGTSTLIKMHWIVRDLVVTSFFVSLLVSELMYRQYSILYFVLRIITLSAWSIVFLFSLFRSYFSFYCSYFIFPHVLLEFSQSQWLMRSMGVVDPSNVYYFLDMLHKQFSLQRLPNTIYIYIYIFRQPCFNDHVLLVKGRMLSQ